MFFFLDLWVEDKCQAGSSVPDNLSSAGVGHFPCCLMLVVSFMSGRKNV